RSTASSGTASSGEFERSTASSGTASSGTASSGAPASAAPMSVAFASQVKLGTGPSSAHHAASAEAPGVVPLIGTASSGVAPSATASSGTASSGEDDRSMSFSAIRVTPPAPVRAAGGEGKAKSWPSVMLWSGTFASEVPESTDSQERGGTNGIVLSGTPPSPFFASVAAEKPTASSGS